MKLMSLFLFISAICNINLFAQVYVDKVINYKFGSNIECGRDSNYFPNNIFGSPSRIANIDAPESKQEDILCLGFDGEIILSLNEGYIIDGLGTDFKVFENVFLNPITKKFYIEPAVVSVSQNGIDFIEFPYNSDTYEGCAGLMPTIGSKNPFDEDSLNGDKFDLANVGLKWAKYIKIKDITNTLKNNPNHPNYDFTLSGFDLDAIAIRNFSFSTSVENNDLVSSDYFKFIDKILILNDLCNIKVFNTIGELLVNKEINSLDLSTINDKFVIIVVEKDGILSYIKYVNE